MIAKLTDLQRHRWTYPVGAALIVAHVLVSQAEPVKHIFRTDGPEVLCGLYRSAKRVEHSRSADRSRTWRQRRRRSSPGARSAR